MNAAKKGLGRGLSALFGDIEKKSKSDQAQTNNISIADLQRNKYQPRIIFDEEKLSELSLSIKENGIIQPIAVRPNKYEPGKV
jgi:Predicted transcriptional regulators